MKFSEIERSAWPDLQPYLDTCLLPVTGLIGSEQPWEAAQELEFLRDVLEVVEIPFKGRVVTYPAFHYYEGGERLAPAIDEVCRRLKQAGFKYVIVMSGRAHVGECRLQHADLVFCPELPDGRLMDSREFQSLVERGIQAMWRKETVRSENV